MSGESGFDPGNSGNLTRVNTPNGKSPAVSKKKVTKSCNENEK